MTLVLTVIFILNLFTYIFNYKAYESTTQTQNENISN